MRIAYISYEYPPDSANGGIATYVLQASALMANRGHSVEVFSTSSRRKGRHNNSNGVVEHFVNEKCREDFPVLAGHLFAERHREQPFDVIEGPEYSADAWKAHALLPNVPLVVRMHTPTVTICKLSAAAQKPRKVYLDFLRVLRGLLHRGESPAFSIYPCSEITNPLFAREKSHALQAAVVAAPCQDLCAFAIHEWHVSDIRVKLCPYPYLPTPKLLNLEAANIGKVVGFVGRLERRKGIETLSASIPLVLARHPDAKFVFVGDSQSHESGRPYDVWLKEKLGRYRQNVDFRGKVTLEEIHRVYQELDICVFPSLWENFPNVCLEAMSAGRAIVASDAGGMREMLSNGHCGSLVAPANPKTLASAICKLLESPTERARLGELARARVLATYSANVIGPAMEEVYRNAIEMGNPA